jgi:L-ascorbate metabolism protein UlaG (beta-lactamase superfamily)
MQLTKYTHACVRLEDGDRVLVIDPGVFSETEIALADADAVLITHEHPDHLDGDALRAAAKANPELRVWAPAGVAESLADLGDRVTAVQSGASFDAAGFSIETFGSQHAMIHPLVPVIANVGYLVDSTVFHPGDSFTVPSKPVQTLLIPTHAPWSKIAEVIDYALAVRAPQAFQIHDSLLTEIGRTMVEGHVTRLSAAYGTEFRHLAAQESLTV